MLILEDLFLSVTSLRFRAHRYSKHVHSVGKVVIFTGLLVSDVRVSVLGLSVQTLDSSHILCDTS